MDNSILFDILFHDITEAETGDIPSNYKTKIKEDKSHANVNEIIIKLADIVEAVIWLERYAVRPDKVRKWLWNKLRFLIKEMGKYSKMDVYDIINKIIKEGSVYD